MARTMSVMWLIALVGCEPPPSADAARQVCEGVRMHDDGDDGTIDETERIVIDPVAGTEEVTRVLDDGSVRTTTSVHDDEGRELQRLDEFLSAEGAWLSTQTETWAYEGDHLVRHAMTSEELSGRHVRRFGAERRLEWSGDLLTASESRDTTDHPWPLAPFLGSTSWTRTFDEDGRMVEELEYRTYRMNGPRIRSLDSDDWQPSFRSERTYLDAAPGLDHVEVVDHSPGVTPIDGEVTHRFDAEGREIWTEVRLLNDQPFMHQVHETTWDGSGRAAEETWTYFDGYGEVARAERTRRTWDEGGRPLLELTEVENSGELSFFVQVHPAARTTWSWSCIHP